MALTVTTVPGTTLTATTNVTPSVGNLLAQPTIRITGTLGTSEIEAGAVTAAKVTAGVFWYGTTQGSANTYTLSLSGSTNPAALADGLLLAFKVNATNTGASTLNVNSLGAKAIRKLNDAALAASDLRADAIYTVRYNSAWNAAAGAWELLSPVTNLDTYWQATDSGTANTCVVAVTPAPVAQADLTGKLIVFKAAALNTGASTLNVNSLGALAITKAYNTALAGGDIKAGQVVAVVYDGTQYQMVSAVGNTPPDHPLIAATSRYKMVATAAATSAAISFDQVVVADVNGNTKRLGTPNSTTSLTLNFSAGTSGANYNDVNITTTGWYYVWVIYNPGSATTAALCSLTTGTGLSPTMPSGYTMKALTGIVRVSSAPAVVMTHWQFDRTTWLAPQVVIASGRAGVVSWNALATTELSAYQAACPELARNVWLHLGGTANTTRAMAVAPDTTPTTYAIHQGYGGVSLLNFFHVTRALIPQSSSNNIAVYMDTTNTDYRLEVVGFEI